MKTHIAPLTATGMRIGIIAARFNQAIVSNLVDGATDRLIRLGIDNDAIELVWVPGAFEIPLAAKTLAQTGRVDAVLCLGAVIRGATAHFDHVANTTASGCSRVGLDTDIPTTFGVLTTDTIEQALERAGTKAGNKGADTAEAAIEMVHLLRSITNPTTSART